MRVTVYVEGGGRKNRKLNADVRRAFRAFFEKAGFKGRLPAVVACGPRSRAFKDYCIALGSSSEGERPLLLVDSEGAVPRGQSAWEYPTTTSDDHWRRPRKASDEDAHLMVQCMEAWLLADPDALEGVFGPGFDTSALPTQGNLETVSKTKVLSALKRATRLSRSGEYEKGRHSFAALERLSPSEVSKRSAHCRRFLAVLEELS